MFEMHDDNINDNYQSIWVHAYRASSKLHQIMYKMYTKMLYTNETLAQRPQGKTCFISVQSFAYMRDSMLYWNNISTKQL